ncbi:hypothetical protein HMI54_001439 [Coelomomyces lativittatus]|nr:hypothetical protein HMI54_001439 [Coelomomyces lativittatus]
MKLPSQVSYLPFLFPNQRITLLYVLLHRRPHLPHRCLASSSSSTFSRISVAEISGSLLRLLIRRRLCGRNRCPQSLTFAGQLLRPSSCALKFLLQLVV